jgi:eukaryotic-like serine/threonine-protein kinase
MNALGVILVAFVTSAVTSAGAVYAIQRYHLLEEAPAPPPPQTVPQLTGLSEADALTNLTASGLKLMVAGREPSAEAEPGTVIRQEPAPGGTLEAGQAVSVTYALAVPKVPSVAGKTVAEAKQALEELGYAVEVAEAVASNDVAAGLVVEQKPAAGTPLQKKEKVVVQPSAGAGTVEVPRFVGLNASSAKIAAEKANLQLAIQWVALAETATMVVLSQMPAAGEAVEPQSQVKVTINR